MVFRFFVLLSSLFSKKPVVSASYKRRYTSDSHANAGTGLKDDAEEKRGKSAIDGAMERGVSYGRRSMSLLL